MNIWSYEITPVHSILCENQGDLDLVKTEAPTSKINNHKLRSKHDFRGNLKSREISGLNLDASYNKVIGYFIFRLWLGSLAHRV